MSEQTVTVYGTTWCGDCKRAVRVLSQHEWPFTYVDIEKDEQAREYVEKVNRGNHSVPTILFPDGSIMVEPSPSALTQKLASLK